MINKPQQQQQGNRSMDAASTASLRQLPHELPSATYTFETSTNSAMDSKATDAWQKALKARDALKEPLYDFLVALVISMSLLASLHEKVLIS